jgi:disulfide bond formation protein DsbB
MGRSTWDPLNTTGIEMPAKGGNPMLTDDDLRELVAYMRYLQVTASGPAR